MTPTEMSTWTQTDLATISTDAFAAEVMDKASDLIRAEAQHLEWTRDTAPFKARLIALLVAKRTYINPDQEVSTGIGPLSSRVLDEAAMAMSLTESEIVTLQGFAPDGGESGGGLWTLSIGGSTYDVQPTVYAPDDSGSDWEIPLLDVNDPGGLA